MPALTKVFTIEDKTQQQTDDIEKKNIEIQSNTLNIRNIIDYINKFCGKDLSVYSDSFLFNTISQRMRINSSNSIADYLIFISNAPTEIEILLKAVNISYSIFFRNIFDFSILERFVFPKLFQSKENENSTTVRIWSVACAEGQEPYSFSILIEDLINQQFKNHSAMIIATDISEKVLIKARQGEYTHNSVQNMRLSHIDNYFTKKGNTYILADNIKSRVEFSQYDVLDNETFSPPCGIFGSYDMVSCANLLIYYKPEIQNLILKKIYGALNKGGYLMVDESEKSIVQSFKGFQLLLPMGNVFVKQ